MDFQLTRKEAARYLAISLSTFKRYVAKEVPYVVEPSRRRMLYWATDLHRWVDAHKEPPQR